MITVGGQNGAILFRALLVVAATLLLSLPNASAFAQCGNPHDVACGLPNTLSPAPVPAFDNGSLGYYDHSYAEVCTATTCSADQGIALIG
jgi:hypothetical protein